MAFPLAICTCIGIISAIPKDGVPIVSSRYFYGGLALFSGILVPGIIAYCQRNRSDKQYLPYGLSEKITARIFWGALSAILILGGRISTNLIVIHVIPETKDLIIQTINTTKGLLR